MSSSSSSTWTCSKCTFININSAQPICQICLTPQNTPHFSQPTWSCNSCTFLNPNSNTLCQICGTGVPASVSSIFETTDHVEVIVGSKRKIGDVQDKGLDDAAEFSGVKSAKVDVVDLDETCTNKVLKTLKILSYNVWFREDLEMHKRMKALGDLIQMHSPDLMCLQEVTPNIYDIFQQSGWWKLYKCSVSREMAFTRPYFCMQLSKLPVKLFSCKPFRNSIMGRELCVAEVLAEKDKPLIIATSHLESPCPAPPKWDQMYSTERVDQAKEALNSLKQHKNVIFCGDMNWDDKLDGQVPLPDGWNDAWTELRPGELGYTYDTKTNKMLSGNRALQKRLDRFLCSLLDYKIDGIEMIGMEAIPGLSYSKEKKVKKEVKHIVLPVLPSDHYGLLLTISSK
ncbi:Tyrosyl-DNA phosphodiesterase 2 [Heracleum sosnowskyi]|uniref:Tyrosyl-DNA phosphodiesterase 2 n=1 Tax=Heracleum sosnowskyi TaxID=360622 RepID=A0AAD8I6W9_9APIA|nr:Tyrosyl-DNA phosphodiesterase 2 [Heracleum sosnowskyi]